jgi:hypothetical protein
MIEVLKKKFLEKQFNKWKEKNNNN